MSLRSTVKAYLLRQSSVTAVVDDRVFIGRPDKKTIRAGSRLKPTIVLRAAGGLSTEKQWNRHTDRLDVICLASTVEQAEQLDALVFPLLQSARSSLRFGKPGGLYDYEDDRAVGVFRSWNFGYDVYP